MTIKYFTDSFLARLRRAIPQNIQRYNSSDSWVESFADGSTYCRETGVQVEGLRPLLLPETGNLNDAENAKIVYTDLHRLTPVEAVDPRLWAYLAHVNYWPYMVARWGASSPSSIEDRFFFRSKGIGSLVRNGIARLWWFGFLTYDQQRQDPFELTRILLLSQDIQTGLLQRNLGKSRNIRTATLDYFRQRHQQIESLGEGRGGVGRVVQHLCRGLNLAGGVYLLDALETPHLHGILDESLAEFAE
jgi:hypothetical protein